MKQIGIVSDTHGFWDDKIYQYFADCDEVWHAGDIGSEEIIDKLELFKPLRIVFGNIDGSGLRARCKEEMLFDCERLKVYMVHIGGSPGNYPAAIKKKIATLKPDIYVCGHSHILRIVSDQTQHNMLHINPGAAGVHGFHQVRTLVRFKVEAEKIFDMQVIELGKRGVIGYKKKSS